MGQSSCCLRGDAPSPAPPLQPVANEEKMKLLERARAHGKVFDYGKEIYKYVIEYEGGFYYVYHNCSKVLRLEEQLELNLQNLTLEGDLKGASKLKVVIPPGAVETIHFARNGEGDLKLSVCQLYSLVKSTTQPKPYVIKDMEVGVRERALREGERGDYGHIRGGEAGLIYKYALKYPAGCTFLYKNTSSSLTLIEQLNFDFVNLRIEDRDLNERSVRVVCEPGKEVLVSLVRIDPSRGFTMRVEAGVSFISHSPPPTGLPSPFLVNL